MEAFVVADSDFLLLIYILLNTFMSSVICAEVFEFQGLNKR